MKHWKKRNHLDNTWPFFGIFCVIWIIYLGFIVNYWYLSFLIFIFIFFVKNKINKWILLASFFVFLVFVLLFILLNDFSLIELFNSWFNSVTNGGLSKACENYFLSIYGEETTSFIKLVLFNIKDKNSYIFLKQAVDLGIVWLVSSGGFHLSLLTRLNERIFKQKQLVGYVINMLLMCFYSFLLGFCYGCLRVYLKTALKPFFKRHEIDNFNQLGVVGLLIGLFNPVCFRSYSFALSFLVCIGVYWVQMLNLNNALLSKFLVNVVAFVITIPFVIEMNKKIAILTFINSFIFVYFFSFVFVYFFIFSWMPFMGIVHGWLIKFCYILVGNISLTNYFLRFKEWQDWAKTIYYLCLFMVFLITYLIVKNNKI